MKIKDIRLLPLVGATPDGGWDQGFEETDNLNPLGGVHRPCPLY